MEIKHKTENRKLAFVGNSSFTMINFRLGVMKQLRQDGYQIVMIAPKDSAIAELTKYDIQFIPVDIDCKGMDPLQDLKFTRDLIRIYKKERFDAIFHYTIKPIIYGGWAAAMAHIPQTSVVTGLGYSFLRKGWINRVSKMLYRSSLKRANEVWFLNQEDRVLFVEQNLVTSTKTRIIPGEGINLDTFHPMEQTPHADFVFLFVGRVLWDKGIDEYEKAAEVIKQQLPNIRFQILGPLGASNPASVSQEQMDIWVKKGAITYLGETQNVIPYLTEADCVVLPSYREGVSRVLLEAAAMEKPIIATDVPGCRDVVVHGKNGFLCEQKNISSLVSCMMRIISLDDKERKLLGTKGRQHVMNKYSENHIVEIYRRHLQELFV